MSENVEKKNGNEVVKWLKVGGILCAIAGGAALLLTSLNLLTAPIIEQNNASKQLGGYKMIFANMEAKSDAIAIEGDDNLSDYVIAYSDAGKTQEIGYIYSTKSMPVKSYGNIKALIGISGETDSPVLGKVYLVEDSLSYKTQFETGYVEPYNANPNDTTLNNVKCGATYGAQALQAMINSARDHYSSIGDSFKEDLASDITAIWGNDARYSTSLSTESTVAGATYLKKSYSFFEDDTMTGEVGRLYAAKYKGDAGDIYLTVSIKGSKDAPVYDKLVITKNTLTDTTSVDAYVTAYNANPSEETLNATTGTDTEKIKAMVNEAKTFFVTDGGLKSNESYLAGLYAEGLMKAYSEPTVLEKDSSKMVNVLRYWSVYSDTEKTTEIAKVYKIQAIMHGHVYTDIDSDTVFLLSISGEKSSPVLGKMALLKNEAGSGQISTIGEYVNSFDGTQDKGNNKGTGATYTLNSIWDGIEAAKALYSAEEGK